MDVISGSVKTGSIVASVIIFNLAIWEADGVGIVYSPCDAFSAPSLVVVPVLPVSFVCVAVDDF